MHGVAAHDGGVAETTVIEVADEAGTDAVAARVAARLRPGDVIALEGPMGAGKTRFVRGLVRALGGEPRRVSSPTFVLLNVYPPGGGESSGLTVYHLDAYRVHSEADLEAIGFEELLGEGGVVVVEWPSRVPGLIPAGAIRIEIEPIAVEVTSTGESAAGARARAVDTIAPDVFGAGDPDELPPTTTGRRFTLRSENDRGPW